MEPSVRKVGQSGKIWILSLIGLALLLTGGLFAYRFIFHRAGEAAASLLPSDATLVATLDVTPGPDQVALFGRISKSLLAEQGQITSKLAASTNGTTFYAEIIPHLRGSYAVGAWAKPGAKPTDPPAFAGLATVDSAATAEAIAAKHGLLQHLGSLPYYAIKSENACIAIIQGYLVFSDKPEALARVQSVSHGEIASVTSLASFQEARTKLPSSANLMLFGNMSSAVDWSKKFSEASAVLDPATSKKAEALYPVQKLTGWATFAATLRDPGIETLWRVPYDPSLPGGKLLGHIAPIDAKLYSRLPAGPYGFMTFAQPAAYYEAKDELSLSPEQKKSLEDGLKSFEKETGLDIQRDLVTGLKGNLTLAIYPAREAMSGIPDGLVLLDDANGADPATMLGKIKEMILAEYQKSKEPAPTFTSVNRDGATIWSLDKKMQDGLRSSAGLKDQPGAEPKQLLFATVGHSVFIASSESLLNRAIAAYNTGSNSLATDPAYTSLLKRILPDAQNVCVVSVPEVMERLKPLMADMFKTPGGPKLEDVTKVFGTRGNGLVCSQGYDGKTLSGNFFMPLDYEAVIHLMSLANPANKQKGAPSGVGSGAIW